jgi:phage tail sheath protein FI
MPEYLSPGVYVEEIEIGAKPIEGASTSTAGFLGEAERGPTLPRLVTSWLEYQRLYGSYFSSNKYLPYAVEGFFKNGGQRCYIARIIKSTAAKARLTLKTVTGADVIVIYAIGEGSWGKRVAVKTRINDDGKTFRLSVFYWKKPLAELYDPELNREEDRCKARPDATEVFYKVSVDKSSPDYYETTVNRLANLIQIDKVTGEAAIPAESCIAYLAESEGNDAEPSLDDYIRSDLSTSGQKKGLTSFEDIDSISIVYIPNIASIPGLFDDLISHCEKLKDRFAIVDVAKGTPNPTTKPGDTKYAAFYCPWIKIMDPQTSLEISVPPGGYVAGIYARSDNERGVHKAPANEVVTGADDVEYAFDKAIQDTLNPKGMNCIRAFTGRGIRVWGARTISSDPLWKYINVRRLFIYLEKSIGNGTQWVVFEPNNEKLWARVKQAITQFLTTVWKSGALMGKTPEEAFFVKCDRSTMTQDDIDNGRLIVIIGVAPTKPAEFVIFRIAQWQGGSAATE